MGVRLVREPSQAPNITNKDDAKMVRYAYGGYDGVVKAYGQELGYAYENGIFKIGSGRVVLQGWEVDIDESGWTLNLQSITGTRYYTVYLEVNLITERALIKSTYGTGDYPSIFIGDDLTTYPNGIQALVLYRFKISGGEITAITREFNVLNYLKDFVQSITKRVTDLEDGTTPVKIAEYASNDYSKGTIDERLNSGVISQKGSFNGSIPITETGVYAVYLGNPFWSSTVICIPDLNSTSSDGSALIKYDSSSKTIKPQETVSATEMYAYLIAKSPVGVPTSIRIGDVLSGGGSLDKVSLEMWVIDGAELKEGDKLVYGGEEATIWGYEDGMYDLSCRTNGWFHSNKNSELSGLYRNGVLTIK